MAGIDLLPSSPHNSNSAAFILVVDDEPLVRLMVSEALRAAGFNVIEAFNADEAIDILRSGVAVNLMLSDVRMPGSMDGLGLLEYSKATFPTLPVIITSGHLLPSDALARGAAHFLGKPYSFDHAITLIEQELSKSR